MRPAEHLALAPLRAALDELNEAKIEGRSPFVVLARLEDVAGCARAALATLDDLAECDDLEGER